MKNLQTFPSNVLKELESIQTRVGSIQNSLLEKLISSETLSVQERLQNALIQLESVQRKIGEVQVELFHLILRKPEKETSTPPETPEKVAEETELGLGEALEEENWIDPEQWLQERNITIKSIRTGSGLDAAADNAAFQLGLHFEKLQEFYESIKRCVSGKRQSIYSMENAPNDQVSQVVQFGKMLYKCGFLENFQHVKRKKQVVFIPLNDGRVTNFFTGGWLERYVMLLIRNFLKRYLREWSEEQVIRGTKIILPNEKETELDILVGLPRQTILWLECKTGEWRNYITRFKGFNQKYLKLPREQTALVLVDKLTAVEKESASELTGMNVLHVSEVSDWLAQIISKTAQGL